MSMDIVPTDPVGQLTQQPAPAYFPADATTEALGRLKDWVVAASSASALVAPLIDTPFIPATFKPKLDPRATPEDVERARRVAIANATGAVLQGITLGLDPLTSLQQIYVVHGRPGMYAKMMVALVQSKGHEVWTEDLTDTRAVVCGRRKGTQHHERVTVTMDQARRAGWVSANKSYGTVPQDMLWARAAGRVCDRIASDVIKGIATVEQLSDTSGQRSATRTVRSPKQKPIMVDAEEPDLEFDEDHPAVSASNQEDNPAPVVQTPDISRKQRTEIIAMLRDLGIGKRKECLTEISLIIGRDIASTTELSASEGIRIIDELDRRLAQLPVPAASSEPVLTEESAGDQPYEVGPEEWPVVAEVPTEDS